MSAADWDGQAAAVDDEADHGLADPETRAAWRALLCAELPQPPARVADVGCGTGTLSVLLAAEGYAVDGVDFSPAMIERAAAKTTGEGSVRLLLGDAARPPLDCATYDVVLCRHVLWALPDPEEVIGRWVDLLAPGGRLVLVEGNWSTGAGLTASECEAIVRTRRTQVEITALTDPVLWGKQIGDERYLLTSLR